MKKRDRVKRRDNVVFFPGIEQRLTDKGLENLHNRNFTEAIVLLEEAREFDPENEDVLIGLALAYFEASSFKKAKVLTKELLLKGIGDYFQLVDLYLTVLIQLHEYEEIVSTIEALLEEKEIPPEKYEHFRTLLQFSRRMAESLRQEAVDEKCEKPKFLNQFSIHNLNEQMLLISSIADQNIRPYVPEIEAYLQDETGHPFLKTILLSLLREQEFDHELTVRKFSLEARVIPAQLPDVRLQPKMKEIKDCLENHLGNSNPVLVENVISLVDRIFFISYPFNLEPDSSKVWAAAFHAQAEEYFGYLQEPGKITAEYHVSIKEFELAKEQIEQIEKISYPNI
ncbi:tetratricopeptide repeat protein [Neobacillus fumarioli]|uniref:tetratricopeptide repeat protein n=1 Tax=Neobacillus fumarioli TaxID=105229 RepID=UPI00083239E8|nr:tetratricopeptide repeat protein [Neobacillus fumarioli]